MELLRFLRAAKPRPRPIADLVEGLLHQVVSSGATDLHIEPIGDERGRVRIRIDGHLRDLPQYDEALIHRVVARLKVLAGLAVFRTGEPQEGRIAWNHGADVVDLRLSTIPVIWGEKAVVRIFNPANCCERLDDLGFLPSARTAVDSVTDLRNGVVYCVGPSSSGKTTTLYAIAREILQRRGDWCNVVSVEDPVEIRVPGIAQTEIAPVRGFGFREALSAVLRQDPEVLLIGETRDHETARIAIEAGFTGHLVLSTFHVGTAEEVLRRLSLLQVPNHLVQDALRIIVNQRLFRSCCMSCTGQGCPLCAESGYLGRLAIAEVFSLERAKLHRVTPSLFDQAQSLVDRHVTGEEEVERVLGRCSA